jgi:hypothetical protein
LHVLTISYQGRSPSSKAEGPGCTLYSVAALAASGVPLPSLTQLKAFNVVSTIATWQFIIQLMDPECHLTKITLSLLFFNRFL